jgi:phosphoribosylanthranilate isomerase
MLVKICGITRVEDAQAAVVAGAGAIGFVFWPQSPRFIDPFRAARIAAALPPFVTAVGVFVNQDARYINAVAALVKLGAVQLHGDEPVDDVSAISRPVIKAIALQAAGEAAAEWPERVTLPDDRLGGRRRDRANAPRAPGRRPDARERRRGGRHGSAIRN